MKIINIFRTAIIGTVVLISTSCNGFLSVESPSYINPDEFYSTKTEVEIAISGIYSRLAKDPSFSQTLSITFDAGADEGYYNRRGNENWAVGLYRNNAADIDAQKTWGILYEAINLSNLFMEKFKGDSFTEPQANAYLGEVRFLRALCYMNLTLWWNEVPLRSKPTKDQNDNNLAPSSLDEVYEFIADDLLFAANSLPHANQATYTPGRANSMAARALLARLYMKKAGYPLRDASGYDDALTQLEIILSDNWHDLRQATGAITPTNNGYRSLFLTYIQNEFYPKESMFEISFSYLRLMGVVADGRIGGTNGLYFNFKGGPQSYSMVNVSPLLYNKYDYSEGAADIRRDWNIPGYQYTASGNLTAQKTLDPFYCPGKYRRWEAANLDELNITGTLANPNGYIVLEKAAAFNQNFTCVNFPIIRFSDVLLMYAEAANEVNGAPTTEAINALNRVRNRAGLGEAGANITADKQSFFNEIVDERMRELCFEGLRRHDLVRWGLLKSRLALLKSSIVNTQGFTQTNDQHTSYLRTANNFDQTKHLSLPYPTVEVTINKLLKQKPEWSSAQ